MSSKKPFLPTVALLFAGWTVVSFWPVFLGRVPLPTDVVNSFPPFRQISGKSVTTPHAEMGDTITEFYPWRKFAAESLRRGIVPLWNPYLLAGSPFAANLQSAVFYPLNFIFVLLPAPAAWSLSLMLKVFLAATFTALFLIEIGASLSGAIVAGMAFAFGGFMTSWLAWPQVDSSLWLPLICLQIHRLCREPTLRNAIVLSPLLAMPILAGHPGMAAQVLAAAAAYGGWLILSRKSAKYRQTMIGLIAGGCVGVGIAAIQVVPSAEWLGQISRTLDVKWGYSPVSQAIGFLSRDLSKHPNSAGILIPGGAAYVGVLSLLAAAFAYFEDHRRDCLFFTSLFAVAFCTAYGIQPIAAASEVLPVFSGLKKHEALMLADFSLAVLAGLGMTHLERFQWRGSTAFMKSSMVGAVVAATASLHAINAFLSKLTKSPVDWWRSPRSFRVLLVLSATMILLQIFQVLSRRQWIFLTAVVAATDLLSFSYGYIPFNRTEAIFPAAPLFGFLSQQSKPFRVVSLNDAVPINAESAYGLSTAGGYDFALRRLAAMVDSLVVHPSYSVNFTAQGVLATNNRILDLLNVKYLVATPYNEGMGFIRNAGKDRFREVWSSQDVTVFENLKVLPRAFLVAETNIETISTEEQQLARLQQSSFDPERTVILPPDAAGIRRPSAGLNPGQPLLQPVTKYEDGVNWITMQVNATAPSVLVISQMYYPGWIAYVDGKRGTLLRSDYAFTATAVGAGTHQVEFHYRPFTVILGAVISIVSLLLTAIGFWMARR